MKFFFNGSKKSNDIGVGSGCVLMIGFAALIYFFTLLDGPEDLKEYWFEIIAVTIMGGSLLFSLFRRKGDLTNRHITIENDFLTLDPVNVSMSNIVMDIYTIQGKFRRYHLRDSEGKIAIYSVLEDDLYTYFLENHADCLSEFEEISAKQDGPYISLKCEERSLYYDLETGKYTLTKIGEPDISFVPDVYTYDGKYKKGEPLKKKSNV